MPLVWLLPGLVCDPVAWHRQELVLGVMGAAMGGYLLSALPYWVGQRGRASIGHAPRVTQGLVLAWVLGRLLGGPCLPDGLALAGVGLYPCGLAIALVLPVVRAGAWGMALHPATHLSLPTAQHALTMGLMGSMVLAVMARAWMRRVPGALRLGAGLGLAFALVQLATVLRLTLPATPAPAALCWGLCWALASVSAVTALFRTVAHPILSARRKPTPSTTAAETP